MVKLVKEDLENLFVGKDYDDIESDLKKKNIDKKLDMIQELWHDDWEEFTMDIFRYMGGYKFGDMLDKMIILKKKGQM